MDSPLLTTFATSSIALLIQNPREDIRIQYKGSKIPGRTFVYKGSKNEGRTSMHKGCIKQGAAAAYTSMRTGEELAQLI